MEFSSSGNNVLSRFLNGALHKRIRLGESLESFDQLGQIGGVLGFDGDSDDRGHRELHGDQGVGVLLGGKSSSLGDELVDSNKSASVSDGNGVHRLGLSSHHNDDSLDVLDNKILLLAGVVVGSKNSDLLSSNDSSGEDSSEGVESALVRSGHHLGDVHHKGSLGVASSNRVGSGVIHGASVQVLNSVSLGLGG